MRMFAGKKRGQVLAISVTAMFILFVLGLAVIEIGNLVYEKTHLQNIADSGAMEAGTWYARALNLTSFSNKVLVAAAVAAALAAGPGAVPAINRATEPVRKAQDFIAGTGNMEKVKALPWLVELALLKNGAQNGAASIGLFNVETFSKCQLPSFNLKRRTLADVLDPKQLKTKYYYVEESTDRRVDVRKKEVKTNRAGRIYQDKTGKFLIKEQGLAGDAMPEGAGAVLEKIGAVIKKVPAGEKLLNAAAFDIVETGPHTVLVFSWKTGVKQKLGSGFFRDDNGAEIGPSLLISSALVRVDGGSMYFWEMDGASYSPHLDRVKIPSLTGLGSKETRELMKGAGEFGADRDLLQVLQYADRMNKLVSGGVLLH
jgi:hypothetical protein